MWPNYSKFCDLVPLLYCLLKVTKDNLDAVLQQQIMDQFRKDNEALLGHLEERKLKSLEDTKVTKNSIKIKWNPLVQNKLVQVCKRIQIL